MEKINIYSNTHFYKIVCKDTSITECYVGRTKDLTRRESEHKFCCITENCRLYHKRLYQFIRENGGFDNFEVILIETKCFNNKLEASQEERKHIEELNALLNMYIYLQELLKNGIKSIRCGEGNSRENGVNATENSTETVSRHKIENTMKKQRPN